jgi:hypothetical protein
MPRMAGAVTFGNHLVFLLLAGRSCIFGSVSSSDVRAILRVTDVRDSGFWL